MRTDIQRGPQKAPADEVVQGVTGLERALNQPSSDRLNDAGVNCIRQFPARGIRVWGARTCSSDPDWKYVNVRRLLIYLERSICTGTQCAVFEPNGEALWVTLRGAIDNFLQTEWRSGRLMGNKAEEAYFVKCGRDTMTQNDIDNGRLICLVGVAAIRPAEFVIIRIGWEMKKTKKKKGR